MLVSMRGSWLDVQLHHLVPWLDVGPDESVLNLLLLLVLPTLALFV
jgi:hypothetical protein